MLNPNKDHWDTILLFELAAIFAQNGNEKAREVIYERYARNLKDNYEFVETEVLVTLDGLKGLEFVANIQGKQIELDSSYWPENYLLEICKEHYPSSSPQEFLKEKSHNNSHIKTFLFEVEKIEYLREKRGKNSSKRTLSQLLKIIDQGKKVPIIAGKWLNDKEILTLSNLLLDEKDNTKIQSYLRLLSRAHYPLDISNLLPFLDTEDELVKHSTLRILQQITDQRIRNIIESNYNDLAFLYEHLELFVSNFLEKDLSVLCDILDTLKNEEEIHSFGMVIRDILDENTIENPSTLLSKLYSANNCSLCRESFVKRLISAQQLPEKVLRELKYDCEPDIRNMANSYMKEC